MIHPRVRLLLLATLALAPACSSSNSGRPETPEVLKESWQAFLRNDPTWPERRDAWHAGSEADRYQLAEALFYVLIRSGEPVDPEVGQLWQRAAWELRLLGSEARTFLLEALRVQVDRQPRDWVAIDRTATVLSDLHAAPELAALLHDPEEPTELRRAATRALCRMQDPEARDALAQGLEEEPEWSIRAQCAEGLGAYPGDREARLALMGGLQDADVLVREKCAGALARMRNPDVQRALLECLQRALDQGDRRTLEASHDALCTNTGRVLPLRTPVEQWQAIIEEAWS